MGPEATGDHTTHSYLLSTLFNKDFTAFLSLIPTPPPHPHSWLKMEEDNVNRLLSHYPTTGGHLQARALLPACGEEFSATQEI